MSDIGTTYSGLSGKIAEDFGCGEPYITYVNVYQNNIIDTKMVAFVQINEGEEQNKVEFGDVLFTLSSETAKEVGISSVYLDNSKCNYLNSFCFGYRLNDFSILNPTYLPYCFSSSKFRKFILPFAQGSTRYNLNKSDFVRAHFSTPKLDNQIKIAQILDSYTQKIKNEKGILSAYKRLKEHLLREMFI